MNHVVATILSAVLVSTGVLAGMNLIRLFISDWCEGRRAKIRGRVPASVSGEDETEAVRASGSRRLLAFTSLLGAVSPNPTLAQVS